MCGCWVWGVGFLEGCCAGDTPIDGAPSIHTLSILCGDRGGLIEGKWEKLYKQDIIHTHDPQAVKGK